MKISDKLLAEQAWGLRMKLNRHIEKEKIKKIGSSARMEYLNSIQERAYSRYLRRLKKMWVNA